MCEEILADFTGDALADPRFLETLATRNPSKFAPLTETVVNRLESVAQKLSNAGFGASRYFDEIDVLSSGVTDQLGSHRGGSCSMTRAGRRMKSTSTGSPFESTNTIFRHFKALSVSGGSSVIKPIILP